MAVVNAALDSGIRMVDTADAYQNEELVGQTIRERRSEVLLAGKFGLVWQDEVAGGFAVRADRSYVLHACEASLRRLGVDVIDLYYLPSSERIPIEETIRAMAELVAQGKVRALGLSNITADDLRRAHTVYPIAALQEQWSLTQRRIEQQLIPTGAELGIVVVAHSRLVTGCCTRLRAQLTNRYRQACVLSWTRSELPMRPRPDKSHSPGYTIGSMYMTCGRSPCTTSVSHLRANVAAANLRLSDDEMQRLDVLGTAP